jgi:hypothetical protein
MLKTDAFELEFSPQLTDKQRRKLEKKAEKQRQKEKPLSTKKQKKLMKELDENVDLRKIDQYVHFCHCHCRSLPWLSFANKATPTNLGNYNNSSVTIPSRRIKWLPWQNTLGDRFICSQRHTT